MIIQQETFYLYHQKYYKLIGIDLSRQTNPNISQEINFTKKSKKIVVQQSNTNSNLRNEIICNTEALKSNL